jgi:hypothetical protein
MDFSLTTLFVVPSGNSVPVAGSTQDLTAGQVGVFLPDYSVATAMNVSGAKYIYVAQGRENTYTLSSKRSDKVSSAKVVDWYKVSGNEQVQSEIWDVSDWTIKCGEQVTLSLRLHSSYIDTGFFNGLTRSVTVQAPCCDCGGDPCDVVDECALIDDFITKLEATEVPIGIKDGTRLSLTNFLTFEKVVTGENTCKLRITGKTLDKYGNPCDVAAFPWEYDRLWFRVWAFKGADTTQDFLVWDNCNLAATTTKIQSSSYPHGTSDEIKQLEKDFYSYQAIHKHLFRMVGYNQMFESYVTDGTVYTLYNLKCKEYDQQNTWGDFVPLDFTVLLAIPDGEEGDIEDILVAYLGAVADKSGCASTTTTTTTTAG